MLLAEDTFPSPNEVFHTEKFNVASWSPNFMTRPGGAAQTIQVSYYSPTQRYWNDAGRALGLLVASLGLTFGVETFLKYLEEKDRNREKHSSAKA
jgi:hypothetical protein